jgi:hypothetical protein
MTPRTSTLLLASCLVGVVALVHAGRPFSDNRKIETAMALWAATPYMVAYVVLSATPTIGAFGVAGILSLSIGPILIFNAQRWFGIDTHYNPIFMATPFLQVACFVPFGLLEFRKSDRQP